MRDLRQFTSALALSLFVYTAIGCTTTPNTGHDPDATVRRACPVTIPNELHPPDESLSDGHRHGNHGNGKLWTTLPADGKVLVAPERDGSLGTKLHWWRTVSGGLTITGRRLDALADQLRASIPGGYGDTGFQASAVYFPTEGCWEITGRVGDAELTFVLEVRAGMR